MLRRFFLIVFFIADLLIGTAYALAFFPEVPEYWSAGAMVVGVSAIMIAIMALGVVRRGRVGRLGIIFGLVFLLLVGAFMAALLLPAEAGGETSLWLGLPRRAAIVIYGVGILPLFLLPIAYAVSFDESALGDAEVEWVRREAARRAASSSTVEAAVGAREMSSR